MTKTKTLIQVVKVKYTGCTAFGSKATVSEAEFELSADKIASVLNTITINAEELGCMVKIGAASNSNLSLVTYKNNTGKILVESKIEKLTWTATGGACGSGGSAATFVGNNEVELVGGTIDWEA